MRMRLFSDRSKQQSVRRPRAVSFGCALTSTSRNSRQRSSPNSADYSPVASAPGSEGALEHDPKRWTPVLGKDHARNNNLEHDDDSKRNHHTLSKTKNK